MKPAVGRWSLAPRESRGDGRPRPSGGAKLRARRGLLLLLIGALMLFTTGASNPDKRFNDLGHRMMCTCGCNQILLECNHVGCTVSDTMMGELRTALTRGDADDLVLQGFVQKYGATVLAAPTTKGFNLMAWIMPFAALGAGTWLAVRFVRRWQSRVVPADEPLPPGTSRAQVEALRQRARQETDI